MESTSSAAHSEERTEESIGMEDFRFPFGDWFLNPWLKPRNRIKTNKSDARVASQNGECINQVPPNPLLPKITMVGISTGEGGQMSRASLKKTMEDLTKELEQMSQRISPPNEEDPLFVANGTAASISKPKRTSTMDHVGMLNKRSFPNGLRVSAISGC
ncbi:hypothetical protein ACLOJK_041395 [Asimina triloba]